MVLVRSYSESKGPRVLVRSYSVSKGSHIVSENSYILSVKKAISK